MDEVIDGLTGPGISTLDEARISHPGAATTKGKHLADGAADELGNGYAQVASFLLGEGVLAFVQAHLRADHVITIHVNDNIEGVLHQLTNITPFGKQDVLAEWVGP